MVAACARLGLGAVSHDPQIAASCDSRVRAILEFFHHLSQTGRRSLLSCKTVMLNAEARLVGVNLEEREDDHASDRNIKPDGEREPCDASVHDKPAAE